MQGYRPDIDGLRAIAVISVVLYHAGVYPFSGGYVGVDVFFVISGFLITRLIFAEIEGGRFSVVNFYERRARRIFPALFVVIVACLFAGWVVMTPSAYAQLAESAIAATAFSANIYFWQSIDYFSINAEFRFLLHTWSLAIEEQFYFIWPICLLLAARRQWRGLVPGALIVFAVSLFISAFLSASYPLESFYLLPSRAWELLLGALLALRVIPLLRKQFAAEAASIIGLLLIVFPMILYDQATTFPGVAAVAPCLGTALVIYSGHSSMVGRALSVKPVVFVGLISYSLYLWHWPLLVLTRITYGTAKLPAGAASVAVVASFALAIISWHYVEKPFRNRRLIDRRQIFALSGIGMATIVACGLWVLTSDGVPARLPDKVLEIAEGTEDRDRNWNKCERKISAEQACRIGKENQPATVLLWGDSHAGSLRPALDVALASSNRAGYAMYLRGCPPLWAVRRATVESERCLQRNIAVLEFVESSQPRIDTVILAARWALNYTGLRAPGEAGADVRLVDMWRDDGLGNDEVFRLGAGRLVERLRDLGIRVVVLGGIPEFGWDVPQTMTARLRLGMLPPHAPSLASVWNRNSGVIEFFESLAATEGVDFVRLAPLLCEPECMALYGGRSVYLDDDHLSLFGARKVLGPKLVGKIWPAPHNVRMSTISSD